MFVSSVESVSKFIENIWGSSENLSDKHLAFKVTVQMVLTSALRESAIHHLGIRFMLKKP